MNTWEFDDAAHAFPRVKIVGIGGGGCRVVSGYVQMRPTAECIYMDTDTQTLASIKEKGLKLPLGKKACDGRSPGADPLLGRHATEESYDEMIKTMLPADAVILVVGLGGRTGSGALPVIAEAVSRGGTLCIPVVTVPLASEGRRRMEQAEETAGMLRYKCDAVIVLPNEQIIKCTKEKMTLHEIFSYSDERAQGAIACLWDAVCAPGVINIDIDELKYGFGLDGKMVSCGRGRATGENKLQTAFDIAVNDPLCEIGIGRQHLGPGEFYDEAKEAGRGRISLLYIRTDESLKMTELNELLEVCAERGYTIETLCCEVEKTWTDKADVTVFMPV